LSTLQASVLSTSSFYALSNGFTAGLVALETRDIAALSTAVASNFSTAAMAYMTTNQLEALSTLQASVLSTSSFYALSNGFTAGLVALETRDIAALSTTVASNFSTNAMNVMTTNQLAALSSLQASVLSTSSFYALSNGNTAGLQALSTAAIAGLSGTVVQTFSTNAMATMSTIQLAALTSQQAANLTTDSFYRLSNGNTAGLQALSTAAIAGLSGTVVSSFSTSAMAILSTAQLAALTTAQASSLTSAQLNYLGASYTTNLRAIEALDFAEVSTDVIAALSTAVMVNLTSDQVAALTTAQAQAMTTAQLNSLTTVQSYGLTESALTAMTTAQTMALTTAAVNGLQTGVTGGKSKDSSGYLTPLVLDLNGDGVETIAQAQGVQFDLDADGAKDQTGWVSRQDGLLVRDLNHDGKINDGRELFGSGTDLADGSKAADGFIALASLDSNGDQVIDAKDEAFKELKVWKDTNQDGVSQKRELHSLKSLGIVQLNLSATETDIPNQGNVIGLQSSFVTTDGKTSSLVDVWFRVGTATETVIGAAGKDTVNLAASLKPEVVGSDLRANVATLTAALAAFQSEEDGLGSAASSALNGDTIAGGYDGMVAPVSYLVNNLDQFDANGHSALTGTPLASVVPGSTAQKLLSEDEDQTKGILGGTGSGGVSQ
jgi:hypothetical protein